MGVVGRARRAAAAAADDRDEEEDARRAKAEAAAVAALGFAVAAVNGCDPVVVSIKETVFAARGRGLAAHPRRDTTHAIEGRSIQSRLPKVQDRSATYLIGLPMPPRAAKHVCWWCLIVDQRRKASVVPVAGRIE